MRHDDLDIAGDMNYGPPEGLYHSIPHDFRARRYGCDLYQLGSMVCFVFTSTTMNAQLSSELNPVHHWTNWRGTFGEVLPYLQEAFARALETIGGSIAEEIREDVIALMQQLCEPDPAKRGDHMARAPGRNPWSLERVITRLDLLSRRAEIARRPTR